MGQSIVLSEIKAEIPLLNEIPSHTNVLLHQYEERITMLSQENEVSKFCMNAGFIHVVEIGQYFMTKDTGDDSLRRLVVNTLFQEVTNHDNRKDGFRETQELDPYWKLRQVVYMANMELRSESGLWDKTILNLGSEFLYGPNKFVIDSNCNNTEVPADLPEEQALQLIVKDFAARSKAKAKPQKREPVTLPSIIPMNESKWIIERGDSPLSPNTRYRRK